MEDADQRVRKLDSKVPAFVLFETYGITRNKFLSQEVLEEEPKVKEFESAKQSSSNAPETKQQEDKTPSVKQKREEPSNASKSNSKSASSKRQGNIQALFTNPAKRKPKDPVEKVVVADVQEPMEQDEDVEMVDEPISKKKSSLDSKKRREELEKMFDYDDDDPKVMTEEDSLKNETLEQTTADSLTSVEESPNDDKKVEAKEQAQLDSEEATMNAPSTNTGRRRGKRKVVRSRKVQTDDGYIKTVNEEVWESFSEDEPETSNVDTKTLKQQLQNLPKVPTKPKKKGAGQASLMSFFGKN